MIGTVTRAQAAKALRKGGSLVRDSRGEWTLLTGAAIDRDVAQALLDDRRLRLAPCDDCLPGFPSDLSQTYARTAPVKRTPRTVAIPSSDQAEAR